jgi:hypothetical protein
MKDFLEFVDYLKKMAIIHDEHFHVIDHLRRTRRGEMLTRRMKIS